MRLEIMAKTNVPHAYLDFIEVKNTRGENITIDWNSYEIGWKDGFSAYCKGVLFNEEYANGRLDEILGLKEIETVQLYSDEGYPGENTFFEITDMWFYDDEESMEIENPKIKEIIGERM